MDVFYDDDSDYVSIETGDVIIKLELEKAKELYRKLKNTKIVSLEHSCSHMLKGSDGVLRCDLLMD